MAQARVRIDSRYQTLYPQTRFSPGSPAAESPLRLAVPLIILLISGFLAGLVRRRRSDTPLLFFLAWVLTDGLLTPGYLRCQLPGHFLILIRGASQATDRGVDSRRSR